MKIVRKKEKRKITLEELIAQKEYGIFNTFRRLGKQLNFALLFGAGPSTFYQTVLKNNWSHSEIKDFIKRENLYELREMISERSFDKSETVIDYLTVSNHMIKLFFEGYPGLKERIDRNLRFVMEHGYLKSIYGATRLLPELYLQGEYDRKNNSMLLHNLKNISANADIQNFEACIVNRSMVLVEKELSKNNIDAIIFNNIHDSADFYVRKKDLDKFAKIVKEIFEKDYPEYLGIPLPIDIRVTDLEKGDYYKHGYAYN